MIYRGEVPITDSDALDIDTLMVAYDAAARPRSSAHYRQVMALRRDPHTAAMHAFNESQLAPERSPQAQAERAAARARQARADQAHRQALLDETMEEFWQRSGMAKPKDHQPLQAPAPLLPAVCVDALAEGDFDLAELFARAQVLADDARRDGEAKLAALSAQLPAAPQSPQKTVAQQTDAALARAAQPAYDLQTPAQQAPLPPELADALALAERAAPGSIDPAQLAQARAALAGVPALQRAARAAAPQPTTLQAPLPDAVALALGARLMAMHRAGECLAGRDFAGASLRNVDLRGADLRQVQLERADLSGACLAGADLSAAALTAARLDHADLSGCRLQPHLVRAPDEPVDAALAKFYARLLAVLRHEALRDGAWSLLDCSDAWPGNGSSGQFIAWQWQGPGEAWLCAAVNYAPQPGPVLRAPARCWD